MMSQKEEHLLWTEVDYRGLKPQITETWESVASVVIIIPKELESPVDSTK